MQKRHPRFIFILILVLLTSSGLAQEAARKDKSKAAAPQAAGNPVTGSGTPGQLPKWTGVDGSNSYSLGNSSITDDKFGNVGIGTTLPTAKLTVAGLIQSTIGGFQFPDGSVQTTAGIANVTHDATLQGSGTAANPLGVAVPLSLSGSVNAIGGNGVITGTNLLSGGNGIAGKSSNGVGVQGAVQGAEVLGSNIGVVGTATSGTGVLGSSSSGLGVSGTSNANGINAAGVKGSCALCIGVIGESTSRTGVSGSSPNGIGVSGFSTNSTAVLGTSNNAIGVWGFSNNGDGVLGSTFSENATDAGVVSSSSATPTGGIAGIFLGKVSIENHTMFGTTQAGDLTVSGKLQVTSGMKMFHIDHPLDPENKYLNHAAIESSEVLNVYSGNAQLNEAGEAIIKLPKWFEALNSDFRYALTPIGAPASNLYIAQEVTDNQFRIAGGLPGMKVSWQVTGVRSDPTARKYRFDIEEEKPAVERGYYLNPDAFGQSPEKSIQYARDPEGLLKLKQQHAEYEQLRKQAKPKQ
jgi:hypothetical protein